MRALCVQVSTTCFPSRVRWIDAVRTTYCAQRGRRGLHWFLSAIPASRHTQVGNNAALVDTTTAGITLRDWLVRGVEEPTLLADAVEEGTIAQQFGAKPFPCTVGSPSGAFVEDDLR